jgi:hypothetical protein
MFAVIFSACFLAGPDSSESLPEKVSYNFHIRPILSDKCFKCHGPDGNSQEAGLRLDNTAGAYAALKESRGAYAIVPGKPEQSEVYKRIISTDPAYQMPTPDSHLGLLSNKEKALFKKWIEQGAIYENHWSFQKPVKAAVPAVKQKDWVRNEIDNFVLSKLENAGLKPNAEAGRDRLIKRIAVDLTGLLPEENTITSFLNDSKKNFYERAVDSMLASPQFGEKMSVFWLDIGRYADSYGYQDDNIRTQWPWRDWVIHAFNSNMPYDKFLTMQLAGDMLPNATKEDILATAFLRNHKYTEEGGVIPEEYRIEYTIDKTKTYSKGILGLTVECAQCHDHKYDPISQKDYFQLFAFFNNSREKGFEGDVTTSDPAKTPLLQLTPEDIRNTVSFVNKKDSGNVIVSVMGELDTTRTTYLLERGVYDRPSYPVKASALKSVLPFDSTRYPGNRLGLAKWTVSRDNPLTARVFVNQIWQELFGRGLVKTSGDFGMQGELPTHPELLDWLAVDFMDNGWNIKRLVKTILMSATYRQAANISPEALANDPENLLLSHAPRVRVKAEFIRDMVLSSSGLLVNTIGGPSVKPYQPKGLWEAASSGRGFLATYRQDTGASLYRRGMYTLIKLTVPPPSLILFDGSNRDQCEVKRSNTNTPLQALAMMNDPVVLEASRVFAQKLVTEKTDAEKAIHKAVVRILCREPSKDELDVLVKYYDDQVKYFRANKPNAEKTINVGEYPKDHKKDVVQVAALMRVINTVYNLEETIVKS